MPKLNAFSCLAATIATFSVASLLPAQRSGLPQAPPGVPITAPPVDHPALAAQPLMGDASGRTRATPVKPDAIGPAGPSARNERDPVTAGAKVAGKDLKKAVAKVSSLKWRESLSEARVQAAAQGKPILWVQALGDIDGFA
ncbi:MAG: hypothetical protein ABIP94_17845 [Planctomycetota bacterium]